MTWTPIPSRQPGELLAEIDFRAEPFGWVANFRHHDNRVWQARIVTVTLPDNMVALSDHERTLLTRSVQLSSSGCRTYCFLTTSTTNAKRIVRRFANVSQQRYDRLVADARGTSDHPRSNDSCAYTIKIIQNNATAADIYHGVARIHTLTGIGRVTNNHQIVMFPNSDEITEIMDSVVSDYGLAIVPQNINVLLPANTPRSFAVQNHTHDLVVEIDNKEVAEAFARLFADTADNIMAGLKTGDYTIPRGRQARMLDLGSDDAAD